MTPSRARRRCASGPRCATARRRDRPCRSGVPRGPFVGRATTTDRSRRGDSGFMATIVGIARATASRATSVRAPTGGRPYRTRCGAPFRLAVEKAPAGSTLHAVAEEGVQIRQVAEVIGRHLGLPVVSPECGGTRTLHFVGHLSRARQPGFKRTDPSAPRVGSHPSRTDRRSRRATISRGPTADCGSGPDRALDCPRGRVVVWAGQILVEGRQTLAWSCGTSPCRRLGASIGPSWRSTHRRASRRPPPTAFFKWASWALITSSALAPRS